MALQHARLVVEPLDRGKLLVAAELRAVDRRLQHPDGLVIDADRHRERMPVLAAMREGEARRVAEAARRAVHDLRHHGQRPHGARADARHQQQFGEIGRAAVGRRGEIAVEAARDHVLGAHVVMRRHDEMRQRQLAACGRRRRAAASPLSMRAYSWAMRSGPSDCSRSSWARREASARRSVRLTISPWLCALDRRMRLVDEALQALRQPVIAARLAQLLVHALLHDDPAAVVGDDEAVQIELEAVLHGGAVDLGDQPAGLGQRRAVEADPVADRDQLVRRLARMLAAAAADMDAELRRAAAAARASARR